MNNLISFLENGRMYPFHMPGHKLNPRFLYSELLKADITEITGADVLCMPSGVLSDLQKRLARNFGAGESFILTNGSTCGVISAVLSVCGCGDIIIAAQNAHKSFFSGVEVSGAQPVYITPDVAGYGFAGNVSPKAVEAALAENNNAKAVFVTSPTYEGVVSDIIAISRVTREHGVVLIVDEAHGAHFAFSSYFPKTALEMGADIVVQSLHKTLPALTQTAVLHVRHGFDAMRIKRFIHMLQTSSPSYMFMAQIDFMSTLLETSSVELFNEYVNNLCRFRERASALKSIKLIGREINTFDVDLGKLVFYYKGRGIELERCLRECGVQVEAAFKDYVIAMTSIADTTEGFDMLLNGLASADGKLKPLYENDDSVNLMQYIGKTAAGIIAPFPPGVPLVAPGETLTKDVLNTVAELLKSGTVVLGVSKINGRYCLDVKD